MHGYVMPPAKYRFLQTDPIPGGSANGYDYCNQDPINCYDLNGQFGWKSIKRFVKKHKVLIGVGLGVLSIATGGAGLIAVGAFEASTAGLVLSTVALGTGLGAAGLDGADCAHHPGFNGACLAAGTGAVGALMGVPELAVGAGWAAEPLGQEFLGLAFGGIFVGGGAAILDAGVCLAHRACRR